jgi:hypothetical protein
MDFIDSESLLSCLENPLTDSYYESHKCSP